MPKKYKKVNRATQKKQGKFTTQTPENLKSKDLRRFVDDLDFTGYSSKLIESLQASFIDMEIKRRLEFELLHIEKIVNIGISNAQINDVVVFINKLQLYAKFSAEIIVLIAKIKSKYDIFEEPHVKEQRLLEMRRKEERLLEMRRIEEERLLEMRRTKGKHSLITERYPTNKQRSFTIEGYPIKECPRCGMPICVNSHSTLKYFNVSYDGYCHRLHKCHRSGEDAFYKRYR